MNILMEVLVERQMEKVYKRVHELIGEAKIRLKAYLEDYNKGWPHRTFDGRTPDEIYFEEPKHPALWQEHYQIIRDYNF